MQINDNVFTNSEKITFALRSLYLSKGYVPYRMSKFEEYDLYAKNKDFLVSDNVITFTGNGGKLMALKPDVTLSIIKNSKDIPEETQKVFYNENVYRVSKAIGQFKEIMQSGVECFGRISDDDVCEVISMAADSIKLLSEDSIIAVSNLDIIESVISKLELSSTQTAALISAISEKNIPAMSEICRDESVFSVLKELISMYGKISDVVPKLESLLDEFKDFEEILEKLKSDKNADMIYIDFSVTDDINYYKGLVFKGFIKGIPVPVLSGGQYDNLMKKMKRNSAAVGFAVYTDELERLDLSSNETDKEDDEYLNVALPKGRLGEKVYDMFARAGFECPSILEQNRKLIFENADRKVRYFWVKPSDVAIYVERGAADIGVAGKDILLEYEPDVYELIDLNMGKCRMCVAAQKSFEDDSSRTLRVATKFSNIAQNYYRSKGRDIDIIHLNGSIEIAPILGLSDVIVDIVETGTTLKENDLEVKEEIVPVSARFISNKSAYKFKSEEINAVVAGIKALLEE